MVMEKTLNAHDAQEHLNAKMVVSCSWCQRIRVHGKWVYDADHLLENMQHGLTHGICQDCAKHYYPEFSLSAA